MAGRARAAVDELQPIDFTLKRIAKNADIKSAVSSGIIGATLRARVPRAGTRSIGPEMTGLPGLTG